MPVCSPGDTAEPSFTNRPSSAPMPPATASSALPLQRLIHTLRPHRRQVWLAAGCSVLNKLFDLAPPVLIGLAVDVVVKQDTAWLTHFGVSSVPGQLGVLAVLSFVI